MKLQKTIPTATLTILALMANSPAAWAMQKQTTPGGGAPGPINTPIVSSSGGSSGGGGGGGGNGNGNGNGDGGGNNSGPGGAMTIDLGLGDTKQCDSICANYRKHSGGVNDEVIQACGAPSSSPTPISTDGIAVHNTSNNYASYDECKNKIISEWGQLSSYCDAIRLQDTATTYDQTSAGIYTGVAAVCMVGCALEKSGYGAAVAQGFRIACEAGDAAANAVDISMDIGLAVKSSKLKKNETSLTNPEQGGEAVAAILAASGTATAVMTNVGMAQSALKKNELCISGAVMAAAAAIKWGMQANYASNKGRICKTVVQMQGFGAAVVSTDLSGNSQYGGAAGRLASNTNNISAGAGSGIQARTPGGLADAADVGGAGFPGAQVSAALGDGGVSALNRFPNRDKFPSALGQLGTSFKDISSQIAAGASPSSILGGIDGLQDAAQGVKELERMAKAGELSMAGADNSVMTSGGGGAKSSDAAKDGGGLFGNLLKKVGLSATAEDQTFGSTRKPQLAASEDGDIFHEHFQGSIFQIVSQKLGKTQDRVETMEWQSPLNRALNGLSNQGKSVWKPTTSGGH